MDAGRLQKMLTRQRPLRRVEKCNQQGIFAFGQRDRNSVGIAQAPAAPIKLPTAESTAPRFRIARRGLPSFTPAQHGADPRQKLAQTERLGDVVVGAQFESDHAVDLVATVAGGDDHGNIRTRPNFAKQVETICLAEPEVENHQAWFTDSEQASYFVPPGRRDRLDVVFFEIVDHEMPHGLIVFDNQNPSQLAGRGTRAWVGLAERFIHRYALSMGTIASLKVIGSTPMLPTMRDSALQ